MVNTRKKAKQKFSKNFKSYILKKENNTISLEPSTKDVKLYHLFLIKTLSKTQNKIERYHFVMLRQLLENITSFLGLGHFRDLLENIGFSKKKSIELDRLINALSHENTYQHRQSIVENNEKIEFIDVLSKIKEYFKFKV